ncbi:hypothetical protein BIW11_12471, partial [Tropilaelaps mercedesae]
DQTNIGASVDTHWSACERIEEFSHPGLKKADLCLLQNFGFLETEIFRSALRAGAEYLRSVSNAVLFWKNNRHYDYDCFCD